MTGLLNAIPGTALFDRLGRENRLRDQHRGDQFVETNVLPLGMSLRELYRGYRSLLLRLYDFENYRRRAMALVLSSTTGAARPPIASGRDLAILIRTLVATLASPRRALLTLRILTETAFRRPSAMRLAVTLVLVHRHLHPYSRVVARRLDVALAQLGPPSPLPGAP